MATWVKVVAGFDAEDETINFGTRNFAENNGSIYETWTLATIQSGSEVVKNPNVSATLWHERLCVAVDTCITVFADQSCQNVLSTARFDTPITSYCLSSDGSFLFASIEAAKLHCFHLLNGGRSIFCVDFQKQYHCDRIVKICLRESDNLLDVIVVTAIGKIYRIKGMDQSLANNLEENFNSCVKSMELLSTGARIQYAAPVELEGFDKPENQSSMVLLGDELSLWPEGISCGMNFLPFKYKKVQFFQNYRAMVCLRTDGGLSIVCPRTLLGKKVWNGPVVDFITLQEKSEASCHMLVLMAPKDNDSPSSLHLMSFPDFKVVFTMSVPSTTYLVDIVGGTIDHLIFLEGMKDLDQIVDTIRIKAIGESMPEYRLQRLLRQGRFDEAREFAKKFNLGVESVFRAEASMLMYRLRPTPNNNETDELASLLDILEKITDIEFVYECCNNALTRDYNDNRRLFVYARKRIAEHINKLNGNRETSGEGALKLLHDISNTLRKLETFEIIQKTRNKVENGNIDEWIKFSKSNLLDECIKHLSLGELDAAALIWTRHTPCIAQKVKKDMVKEILGTIPGKLGPSELLPWLRHFIPSVTSFLPVALADIIEWAYKKTRTLEKLYRDAWPNIGLKFAGGLINLLNSDEYNVCFQFRQQYANKNSQFHKLTELVQVMSDLLELKTRYKVVLPLNTYLGNPTDVVTLLLNKVHVDGIPGLLQNFLHQYMLNHSLQNDLVLSTYVQNTLRNTKDWWLWEKAPWDKRLTVVISYIHNVQNRLQQTLEVLKKAPVPWSESLIALAEQSYTYDHPLVSKIRFESNSVSVKLILKKYGFAQIGLCTKLFHSIVKKDRPGMVNDILELTKTNYNSRLEVFYLCINYHLSRGNVDRMMNVIQELSEDLVLNCCQYIINITKSKLSSLKLRDESLKHYFEVLGPVEARLREAIVKTSQFSAKFNDILATIPSLRALYRLEEEFNIIISQEDYYIHKEEVLLDYITKSINTKEEDLDCPGLCKKIERMNDLLCLPKFYGFHQLLLQMRNCPALKSYMIDRLSQNAIIFPEESFYSSKICSLLVLEPQDDPRMAACLKNLCSSSLVSANVSELPRDLITANRIDAYNEAVGSQANDNDTSPTVGSLKIFSIYKDASVSPGNVLLPLLQDSLKICTFYQDIRQNNSADTAPEREAIELLSKSLLDSTRAIQNEYHDFSLLKIVAIVHAELATLLPKSEKAVMEIQAVLSHCLIMMLKKVISSRVFDLHLGLACLFMLPQTETLKTISAISKLFQTDYSRHRIIMDLGYEYCRLSKNGSEEKFNMQRILHCWAQRLMNYEIPYSDTLFSDMDTKRIIMCRLMKSKKSGVIELLRDFCNNFGFDLNDCFLSYLQSLLCSWQPKYDANSVAEGHRDLKVDEADIKELTELCKKIASQIPDQKALKNHLDRLKPQINFYHYEIFLILSDLTQERKIEEISYLCFLQNYTRVGAPTEIEIEEWAKISQDNQSLPAISKWRLPFLPKFDPYKFITPELNLKTYENWLRIAPVLKIPVHNICTLAVKGAVAEAWKPSNNDRENRACRWSINSRNSTLLKDIKTCIEHITGPKRLYYGTAALYCVVNNTPPGADRVAAAKECFAYAQRLQQEPDQTNIPEKDKLLKIKNKYLKYTSMHILYTHGLGQDKYLNLVEHPEKLVRELYQDETIPQRYRGATGYRPDINSAVNSVGILCELNLKKIRLELLNEWLRPENYDSKVNDSMTTNIFADVSASSNDTFTTDDNLLKACYIVDSGERESYMRFLITISFSEHVNDCYSPGERFRALRVLQSLTDKVSLQNYLKRDIQVINQYMKSLQYVTELERLGLGYSVSSFDACSKHKLVQILANTQYCVSRALGLIPQIYVDFNIDDYGVLNTALERMVKFSLVKELKKALSLLGSIDRIINCSGYIAAWQIVVTDSFNKLEIPSSVECLEACIETLRLLDICPVVDKLDFNGIINCCFRAEQLHFAAALLPFLRQRDQESIHKKIVLNAQYDEIRTKLMELADKGILMVRQAIMMLDQKRSFPSKSS